MRAAVLHEYGGPSSVRVDDLPLPEPGPGQVRVRVHASAMNNSDLQTSYGGYGRPPLPRVLGQEAAGVIDALGPGVTTWAPGQRVAGRVLNSWAEYGLAPANEIVPLPEGIDWEVAATLPIAYLTSAVALMGTARLRAGEWVLVSPGSGGVGVAAIQLAKLLGANVIATSSSSAKLATLISLGAVAAINYTAGDVVAEVQSITDKAGVGVALDGGGNATFPHCLASLGNGGRVVVYGYTSGADATFPVTNLIRRQAAVYGISLWTNEHYPAALEAFRDLILPAVADGTLKAVVDEVVSLENVAVGMQAIADRRVSGKVVVRP